MPAHRKSEVNAVNIRNWPQTLRDMLKTIAAIVLFLAISFGALVVSGLPWWQRVLDFMDRKADPVFESVLVLAMEGLMAVILIAVLYSLCKRIFRVLGTRIEACKGGNMKSVRAHLRHSSKKGTKESETRKQLVYKIDDYCEQQVIYALPERALFYSCVRTALDDSKTWGEFRHAMPRKEYARLIREIFDDKGLRRPHESDTFDPSQIPETETGAREEAVYQAIMGGHPMHGMGDAMGGAAYPGWLAQDMLHGVLPDDILKKYGEYSESFASGSCVYIRTEDLDEVNAELKKRGYELIDGSDLRME